MDDLAQKLSELLSSPEGLQKLQAAAASVGMLAGNKSETAQPPAPPVSGAPAAEPVSAALPFSGSGGFAGSDFDAIAKLMPLMSGFKQDNQDTLLLKALRPYLQDERRQRLDETLKMMQMLKLLPLLKEKGIF